MTGDTTTCCGWWSRTGGLRARAPAALTRLPSVARVHSSFAVRTVTRATALPLNAEITSPKDGGAEHRSTPPWSTSANRLRLQAGARTYAGRRLRNSRSARMPLASACAHHSRSCCDGACMVRFVPQLLQALAVLVTRRSSSYAPAARSGGGARPRRARAGWRMSSFEHPGTRHRVRLAPGQLTAHRQHHAGARRRAARACGW